ncbi:hypothetical protein RHSIM_Rhsim10G0015700 [Rhododendron simsii]|uniref:BIG2 domain-containing protein n=1 Tax=Rhododendron simsii TaxID=118357 RepID=A0A834GBI3_RHOSS|nr:hypothetical protein RHSIM_Rhsim10G0015700 [Rhododendron simsii]
MAKLTPDCPTGAVSFVQEMGSRSIDWHSVSDYLRTEESLEDYAKFRHSLMDNYSSLVLSAATENEFSLEEEARKLSWDHHDILSVLPEYNVSSHCTTSARLRSIAPFTGRKETAVYATDVNTGMVIRCKVFIDNFSRIQIFHNSIKLDLDGLATLRVRAFDNEGNGLPLSDCGGLCGDLDIQIRLEDSGVFSDLYLIKGTGIGRENVSVQLHEPHFEQMQDKIVLTVAEAMSLDPPSPVFVLIGATVRYCLKVMRGNIPQGITLPSPFHRWSVLNSSVAQVDTMMGVAQSLSLGITSVIVEDTRVAGHHQISSLHVVLPDTLRLYLCSLSQSGEPVDEINPISSVSRWFVVCGRNYLIFMKVFSRGPDGQEIYLTESDDVKLHEDQPGYWNTLPVSDDIAVNQGLSNSRILKATSYGLGKLTATLTYSTGDDETKEVLKVVQEIMVCDQVKFSIDSSKVVTQSILLPWAPSVYQELDLKATGGCAKASSDYKWFSSDMTTVSVSAHGVVQAKKPGKATIKVVSIFDPINYDEVVIEVSIPSSIVMLPNFPVETVVGSHLQAAVTMKASNGAYFHKCDAFSSSIKWKAGSESFAIVNVTGEPFVFDMLAGPPCSWTYVYASSSGRTLLQATLSKDYQLFDHSYSGPIILKASSRIAAYRPLILHQASDGNQFGGYWFDLAQAETNNELENLDELYLAPDTSLDVMLRGGPEPWGHGVDFIDTVETLDDEDTLRKDGVINVNQISSSYVNSYRISCQKLGTFRLIFKRGNLGGDDHPLPAVAEVGLLLRCTLPSTIVLIADEPVNTPNVIRSATQADRSPERMRTTPITVANGRTIRLSSVGTSNSGKAFGNSSSLDLRWELSNCDGLATWDDAYDIPTSKSGWERFLILQNASGLCIVRATVMGFSGSVGGGHSKIPFESLASDLTDALRLQLVFTLRVDPDFSLLFFSTDARLNLTITGGSCFLDAVVNNSQVVEVIQKPSGLHCSQLVLAPKELGSALVTVKDIGLSPPVAAASVVQVADVDWIKITCPEELSLMEGSLQSIDLLAGIDDGSTFDPSQYIYMGIRAHIDDPIVELVNNDDFPSPLDGYVKAPSFIIRARHIGVTTLYISAKQHSGRQILSQPIKVEVYAPPILHPSDIFLAPGASYVLTVRGGPTIGAHVEYASMDDGTATIHKSSGRLSAVSPGNTGNLFSFYELCRDYKWTIDDEKVLSFQGAEHMYDDKYGAHIALLKETTSTSYLDENDLGFVELLYGRSAGRTEVTVSFSCDFISSGSFSQSRSYTASASVWVVSDLPLALGVTWILPPHYTSSSLLPSSSSSYSQFDTRSRKGPISYSLLRQYGGKNEEAQKDVVSIDGDKIRTTESNTLACIQANDRTTGRVEVASCIRVAEVSQIRIAKDFHRIDLTVGAELDLAVSFYDILGLPFQEAYDVVPFNAETNYRDIVSINVTRNGNGNIHLKAMRHGRALVQVSFSSNPQKSDYVMISIGAHLYPRNPVLRLGNQLNFSVEGWAGEHGNHYEEAKAVTLYLVGLNDQMFGRWLSANETVISVDTMSGKAEAIGYGTTQVIFEGSSLRLQTAVTVLKGNILVVDAPREMLTNVPFPAKGYCFPVKFSDAPDHKSEAPRNGVQVLYDCWVDPPFVGYAKPWKDLDTGVSYCLFFPYTPEHLALAIPKSKDMRQDISVSINVSLRGAKNISGSASALFVGGFSILEADKNSMQLNLTPESNRSIITIVGNTDVEVHWHNQDQLIINLIHREDFGIGGRAQYEVKALGAQKFTDKLILTLPANGQREEIDVNYEPRVGAASEMATNTILWVGIIACIILLILTVIIFICYLDRPDRSRPSTTPAPTPTVVGPVTPDRGGGSGSPVVVNGHSPRTPQPYIEYVRRTIDETPYYRRDGRRRVVNPQNTF